MRIITGKAKGLKLKTPAGFSTRPTSDRVKESLFSILNGLITFAEINSVLDIFAGTGALGIESISRGASSATFIDAATTDIIRDNVTRAKFSDVCKIFRGDFIKILQRLSRQSQSFDLIFSDPPYATTLAQSSLNLVAELNLLNITGLMIVEHGTEEILAVPKNFTVTHQRLKFFVGSDLMIVEHGTEEILAVPKNFKVIRQISYGHTSAIEIFCKERLNDC